MLLTIHFEPISRAIGIGYVKTISGRITGKRDTYTLVNLYSIPWSYGVAAANISFQSLVCQKI